MHCARMHMHARTRPPPACSCACAALLHAPAPAPLPAAARARPCLQVAEHLQALGKPAGIRVAPLVGGIAPVKQERLLRAAPPVVVATPGRLWDLMRHGHPHLTQLEGLSFFVLDEADRMMQQVCARGSLQGRCRCAVRASLVQ